MVLKPLRVSKIHRLLRMMERRIKIIPHPKVKTQVDHLVKTEIPKPIKKVRVLGLNPRKEKVLVLRKILMPIKKVRVLVQNLVMVKKKILVPVLMVIPARSPTR